MTQLALRPVFRPRLQFSIPSSFKHAPRLPLSDPFRQRSFQSFSPSMLCRALRVCTPCPRFVDFGATSLLTILGSGRSSPYNLAPSVFHSTSLGPKIFHFTFVFNHFPQWSFGVPTGSLISCRRLLLLLKGSAFTLLTSRFPRGFCRSGSLMRSISSPSMNQSPSNT